jgi:hypothetical protein
LILRVVDASNAVSAAVAYFPAVFAHHIIRGFVDRVVETEERVRLPGVTAAVKVPIRLTPRVE